MSSSGGVSRVRPSYLEIGERGKYFNSGRGPVAVPNGQVFRLLLSNPVGSGVLMKVHRFRYYTTHQDHTVIVRLNPTTNLPTFAVPSTSQRLGAPNGVCTLAADVAGVQMSGGATLPYELPMEQARTTEYHIFPTRILPPGNAIGTDMINVSGGTDQVVFILDWLEEPLDF